MAHVVGLRLEDKSRWERRVPIVPGDVERLRVEHGVSMTVQPSPIRIFNDEEYRQAGAAVAEDLSAAGVILAVKEVPIAKLLPGRCYGFFAHVIKGQRHNMPLLQRVLDLGITLVDYEKITDANGRRLVKFGRQAGQAGMIDSFWSLGQRLRREGRTSPFDLIEPAHHYSDLGAVEEAFAEARRRLLSGLSGSGLKEPLIVGFMGRGSVTQGALDIFDLLPHDEVAPEELPETLLRPERDRLFKVMFEKHHMAEPKDGSAFDGDAYRRNPELFRGCFEKHLPSLTMLINGIYWTDDYPRFVSKEQVQAMWRRGEQRLRVIGDITCDIDGAIELTYKSTQPDAPTYVYDPEEDAFADGFEGPGVCVLAVDNLPCELPRDASVHFSRHLRELVPALAEADYSRPFAELHLPAEVRRAVIAHRGELTPDFKYLEKPLKAALAQPAAQKSVAEKVLAEKDLSEKIMAEKV